VRPWIRLNIVRQPLSLVVRYFARKAIFLVNLDLLCFLACGAIKPVLAVEAYALPKGAEAGTRLDRVRYASQTCAFFILPHTVPDSFAMQKAPLALGAMYGFLCGFARSAEAVGRL